MRKYSKEEAVKIVVSSAEKYRDELLNRNILFVCADKHMKVSCIETAFYDINFLHLTGLKVHTGASGKMPSAADFFRRCTAHKLSPSDFEFSADGTTHLKLDILPAMLNKSLSANMLGNCGSLRPKLYTEKLAGSTKACMGFVKDALTGAYVPNTVLNADIRDNVSDRVRIIATFRKSLDEEKYTELTYRAKKVDWEKAVYPDEYAYLSEV